MFANSLSSLVLSLVRYQLSAKYHIITFIGEYLPSKPNYFLRPFCALTLPLSLLPRFLPLSVPPYRSSSFPSFPLNLSSTNIKGPTKTCSNKLFSLSFFPMPRKENFALT
ncbi:hypothetical protein F4810DRAFT_567375 [Camillea tinctor]|nr:hypothetical protein F4810DRAFT_567375 [Camillea tinctor]